MKTAQTNNRLTTVMLLYPSNPHEIISCGFCLKTHMGSALIKRTSLVRFEVTRVQQFWTIAAPAFDAKLNVAAEHFFTSFKGN